MSGEGFVLAIAQIGLSLAGFAGLVSVFRKRGGDWVPQDTEGFRVMLEHTLASTFFALLPLQLSYQFGIGKFVWRLSSFLLAIFLIVEVLAVAKRNKRLILLGAPARRPRVLKYFYYPVTLSLFILEVFNALLWGRVAGYELGASMACYTWALLWLLIAAATQFLTFTAGDDK